MSNAAQRSELQAKPLKDFNMDTDSSLAHCGSLIFNAAQQQVLSVPLPLPLLVPMSVFWLLFLWLCRCLCLCLVC